MTNMKENELTNFVQCDCCGLTFPQGHMSDHWTWQMICGYCADVIEDELEDGWPQSKLVQ
jgi:hypothetical protein